MKRLLLILWLVVGAVLFLGCGIVLWIDSGLPTYTPQKIDLRVEVTAERVARGRHFSSMLCNGCHLDPATGVLSGRPMPDVPASFGAIVSRNITRHPVRGIGAWTDGELAYLLRTGVGRDGRYRPPYMIKLPHLDDEQLRSIIAFLRSDDPLVRASDVAPPESRPSFQVKLLSRFAWKPLPYPAQPIVAPPRTDTVAYGRYLVTGALDCYSCHSADFTTVNVADPERSAGYLGGGNRLLDVNGRAVYSSNITVDPDTGIGKWSEADFVRALKVGFRPDRSLIRFPMQRYSELDDDEARAIFAYLKTVPPLRQARPPSEEVSPAVAAAGSPGQQAFYRYGCNSCHGDEGKGIGDLTTAHARHPYDDQLKDWIRDASLLRPGTKMPTWDGVIAEEDYQPLCDHVRELGERAHPWKRPDGGAGK